MSVVSDRSGRYRPGPPPNNRSKPRPMRNTRYAHSDIDTPFIMPHFSAVASEGVKRANPADDWGENTTVVTGNTSEHSYSGDERKVFEAPIGRVAARRCSRLLWLSMAFVLSTVAVVSAPLMAALPMILPHVGMEWPILVCEVDCQGQLVLLAIKTVLLILALWALYWRRSAADLPRLYFSRAAFALFVLFILFAFWLFYTVRIILEKHQNYTYVVAFSLSLLDALLYTHYISVIVLELRKLRSEFVITIVRDPDGHSGTLNIGMMSMQEAAICVLRHYETSFPVYNAFLDKARQSSSRTRAGAAHTGAGFKMYDIEGLGTGESLSEVNARALLEAASRRRIGGYTELLQEEMDWERRLKKRKYRLMAATEDAFAHVQGVVGNQSNGGKLLGEPMDSVTASQHVYTWIMRPLNKYLRLTRQQPQHSVEKVTDYVEKCLSMKLNYRTFLQRFFSNRSPPQDVVSEAKWSIVSDDQASVAVSHGTTFLLRSHNREDTAGVQLFCTVTSLPFFNLTEQSRASISKFALKISSESSV